MFAQLMERRVPHFLGLYLGSGWVLLEFSDWVVERYLLSPYWVDLVLMVWLLLLPTVLIVTWFHGKPGPDPWTRGQRLIVGGNLVLAGGVLFALAASRDLGAVAERVSVIDETGTMLERVVAKTEYRQRIGFFFFDNQTGDPQLDWMEIGLPILMQVDLYQDVFIDSRGPENFATPLAEAGIRDPGSAPITLQRQLADQQYLEWFVTGQIVEAGSATELQIMMHNTATGVASELIVLPTTDFFNGTDAATKAVRRALDVPSNYGGASRDLPVAQLLTESEDAVRSAAKGYRALLIDKDWPAASKALEQATQFDPGYAHAQIGLFATLTLQNQTEPALEAINAAMASVYRLPERLQFLAKANYFISAKQDIGSAVTILEMATTLYPADLNGWDSLGSLREARGEREGAIHALQQLLAQDPNRFDTLLKLGKLHELSGAYEEARGYYQRYLKARPTDVQGPLLLGGLATATGDHIEALEHFKIASVIDPTNPATITKVASAEFNRGAFDQTLGQLEIAKKITQTPAQRAEVQRALFNFHLARGQIQLAVEAFLEFREALSQSLPPRLVAVVQQEGLYVMLAADQNDDIAAMTKDLEAIAPPVNKMVHALRLRMATQRRDLEQINASLPGIDSLIEDLGQAEFTALRSYAVGVAAEIERDLEAALKAYDRALVITPLHVGWHEDAARVLRELERLDIAAERIQMALTVNPMSGELNLEAARIALAQGDTTGAHRYLDAVDLIWSNADTGYAPAQHAAELRAVLPPRT